ncbi:glycoside hydrolase family 43 protein [Deinococcus sonorensis]|uniref:Glycoside hydrolase family 43 protein n=2 Tax=Deinococcus sonorensis TaxID=309891 RepID=A0AAU7U4J6_9DEIO
MKTYTNPVYPGSFADPFVLQHEGMYYAYGTGHAPEPGGRHFEVLVSPDLIHWTSHGGVLEPLPDPQRTDYWAPEVAYSEGRFYMYYSAGQADKGHQLRVAVADQPTGPFVDQDIVLTPDLPFSIDASPFQDQDGQWYLYYAHDVLEGDRVGTSLSVDRLVTMTRLEGAPRQVLRATQDWQLYAAQREMYGAVYDWYTLEGPFVVPHEGQYYLFYSGGAWPEATYGVSYAVADHPLGPWTEPDHVGPLVLKTVPGKVIGPGHNSVVKAPNGDDVLVYHAWDVDKTARRLCLDRIVWTPDGPRTEGPTLTPQPAFTADQETP